MEKEFGKYTREQVRRGYAQLHEYRQSTRDLVSSDNDPENLSELITDHYELYNLPFSLLVAYFVVFLGLQDKLSKLAQTDDPQERWLDFAENELEEHLPGNWGEQLTLDRKQELVGLTLLLTANIESISRYNLSLHEIFTKIAAGEFDWIFKLIVLDRSIIAHPEISRQIVSAQLRDDNSFFDRLSKAITRTKPVRPLPRYDDFRYMLEVILDSGELKNTQIEDILAHDLELYPTESDYSLSGLKKLIKVRRINKGEVK